MDIIRGQQNEQNPAIWNFKIGGIAGDGLYRLADLVKETTSPADWLAVNPAEAQAAIDAGAVNEEHNERVNFEELEADITGELAWITTAITEIDTGLGVVDAATLAQLRVIVKGLLQNQRRVLLQQRREFKAWRYVVRRVG